ncbi:MAG: hypothetical protein HY881_13900 [Deltaproteobacteria bacterium]|nr:hypothetical protein [Deltaproteobacteria bacterium]
MLEAGYDILTIQELLGHDDVRMATIYSSCLEQRRPQGAQPV